MSRLQRSVVYNSFQTKWLLVKFGIVDRRPGSSRRCSAHTDENVDTVESLLLSQEDKPQSRRTVREISREVGGSIDHQFRGLFTKICVSSPTRKGALNSWLKRTACTRYFRYAVRETMKTEAHELYFRVFWILLPNAIIIDPYNFELYRFKIGAFFETQCIVILSRASSRLLDITGCRMSVVCTESNVYGRVCWAHAIPRAHAAQLQGRSTRQHAGHATSDSGVERRVDDWHCPSVDEDQ